MLSSSLAIINPLSRKLLRLRTIFRHPPRCQITNGSPASPSSTPSPPNRPRIRPGMTASKETKSSPQPNRSSNRVAKHLRRRSPRPSPSTFGPQMLVIAVLTAQASSATARLRKRRPSKSARLRQPNDKSPRTSPPLSTQPSTVKQAEDRQNRLYKMPLTPLRPVASCSQLHLTTAASPTKLNVDPRQRLRHSICDTHRKLTRDHPCRRTRNARESNAWLVSNDDKLLCITPRTGTFLALP